MSEFKWKRIGYAVKHGGRFLGAGASSVEGNEVRVSFLYYRSPAAARRAATLVGGELCEVYQGRGTGVHTPPVVLCGRPAKLPTRRR